MNKLEIALYQGLTLAGYYEAQQFQSGHEPLTPPYSAKLTEITLADLVDSAEATHERNALRQALWMALHESSYLNLVSDPAIASARRKMSYPENTRLTPQPNIVCAS